MASINVEGYDRQVLLDNCSVAETEDSYSVQEVYQGELFVHIVAKSDDTGKAIKKYLEGK